MAVSQDVEQSLPCDIFLVVSPSEMKTNPCENIYTNVHSSVTFDINKVETTQIFFSW